MWRIRNVLSRIQVQYKKSFDCIFSFTHTQKSYIIFVPTEGSDSDQEKKCQIICRKNDPDSLRKLLSIFLGNHDQFLQFFLDGWQQIVWL